MIDKILGYLSKTSTEMTSALRKLVTAAADINSKTEHLKIDLTRAPMIQQEWAEEVLVNFIPPVVVLDASKQGGDFIDNEILFSLTEVLESKRSQALLVTALVSSPKVQEYLKEFIGKEKVVGEIMDEFDMILKALKGEEA